MTVSFVVAMSLFFADRAEYLVMEEWQKFLIIVGITTPCWIVAAWLGPRTKHETLVCFCRLVQPGGPGWRTVAQSAGDDEKVEDLAWQVPQGILCTVLGCVAIYSALFATGHWLYGNLGLAIGLAILATACTVLLVRQWQRLFR